MEEQPLRERVEPTLRPQVQPHREPALPAQHLADPVRLPQPLPHLCRRGVPPLVLALHQQQLRTLLVGRHNLRISSWVTAIGFTHNVCSPNPRLSTASAAWATVDAYITQTSAGCRSSASVIVG